jgi:mersacidin/lichenicidin family type 2 lantibiotic
MASNNLVRVWKDEEYRLSLSVADLALLPANPAGSLELTDAELDMVAGGWRRRRSGNDNDQTNKCYGSVRIYSTVKCSAEAKNAGAAIAIASVVVGVNINFQD